MEKVTKSVEVPKELEEVFVALNKIIDASKQALADGFQPGQDLPAIFLASSGELLAAIDGFQKIGPEYKEEPKASDACIALALADLKAHFVK